MPYSINDIALITALWNGYKPSDQVTDGDTMYFGFLRGDGSWYIQKQTVESETLTTWRYVKGESGYATAIADPTILSYDIYSTVFPS